MFQQLHIYWAKVQSRGPHSIPAFQNLIGYKNGVPFLDCKMSTLTAYSKGRQPCLTIFIW